MSYGLNEWGGYEKEAKPKKTRKTLAERFKDKVEPVGDHLIWQGAVTNGYGVLVEDGKTKYAHRVSYELSNGPIPKNRRVSPCEVDLCVDSSHLSLVPARIE